MTENGEKTDKKSELKQELQSLRSDFELIIEKYSLNVNARLEELIGILEQKESGEEARRIPGNKTLNRLIETLRNLKLKPGKGRGKDVKRIQSVLDQLSSAFQL
jgi:hypothetical protein